MKVIQAFPDWLDFDEINNKLAMNNYDAQSVI